MDGDAVDARGTLEIVDDMLYLPSVAEIVRIDRDAVMLVPDGEVLYYRRVTLNLHIIPLRLMRC